MSDDVEFWAHTPPRHAPDAPQSMDNHTNGVTHLAVQFAKQFNAEELARWSSWLHDIGKYSAAFQAYLRACHHAEITKTRHPAPGSAEHKCAGTQFALSFLAQDVMDCIALCIMGHHGGLSAAQLLEDEVAQRIDAQALDLETTIAIARREMPHINDSPLSAVAIPALAMARSVAGKENKACAEEMLIRFVYSCLVDADSLDTENHFEPNKTTQRELPPLADVSADWQMRLDQEVAALRIKSAATASTDSATKVMEVRQEVYEYGCKAGEFPPGVFSLTVPTGGGKTLSSLAFALQQAQVHADTPQARSRIIYAVPYTSITNQTVGVFRSILDPQSLLSNAILEHHSAIEQRDPPGEETAEQAQTERAREQQRCLAAENWDAPLIVTTTVQLFESLFSNRKSKCRKLHNIANSVLILDEVQTLPAHLLIPLVDGLKTLVRQYGVTVVLCTATQPALEANTEIPYLKGFEKVTPIVPVETARRHFQQLRRVTYHVAKEP